MAESNLRDRSTDFAVKGNEENIKQDRFRLSDVLQT